MDQYRLEVDRDMCSGFGACVDEAAEAVSLDGQGIAHATGSTCDLAALQRAVDACPMAALRVVLAEKRAAS